VLLPRIPTNEENDQITFVFNIPAMLAFIMLLHWLEDE